MKSEKKKLFSKQFKIVMFVFAMTIISVTGFIALKYPEFQREARAKEGLTILNSAYVFLKATDAEEGIFPRGNDPLENFYQHPDMHYKLYSKPEMLPVDLKEKLPESFRPFIDKKTYRLIVAFKDEGLDQYHCCSVNQEKVIQCAYF